MGASRMGAVVLLAFVCTACGGATTAAKTSPSPSASPAKPPKAAPVATKAAPKATVAALVKATVSPTKAYVSPKPRTVATTKAPAVATKAPTAKVYANCTELRKDYHGGVARPGAVNQGGATKYAPYYSQALYDANKGKDRDHDGIACEA